MTKTQEFSVAFAFGALVGGVTALLLAPEKGEVTRSRLKEGAQGLIDTTTGTVHRQAEAVKGAVAEGTKAYREELERSHA